MNSAVEPNSKDQVLDENRRVHALESAQYLDRHPEQTNGYQKRVLRRTLREFSRHLGKPDAEILEVGCGTGYMYLPLLKRGYRMTGVDLSDTLIQVLEHSVPETARGRSRLIVSDIESFLEQNHLHYDGIVCSALLHHLFDYEIVLRQLAAKLRPGGVMLIFFEPLKQTIESRFRFLLHRLLGKVDEWVYELQMKQAGVKLIREDYELADYQRRFGGLDPARLTALLNENGLGILEFTTYCARRNGWAAWFANRVLNTQNTFNLLAKKF